MDQLIIDFEVLAQVANQTQRCKGGDVIFNAGDRGYNFFVIREGSVEIRIGERVIETLGPQEVFGEMAIVDHAPRSATAVAATDCVLVPLSEQQFVALVQAAPHFALAVMRVLVARLRAANAARG